MISLSDFQKAIGAATHGTLDEEKLISHTRTIFVDMLTSLQGCPEEVIQVSEVHELITKIHDILGNYAML